MENNGKNILLVLPVFALVLGWLMLKTEPLILIDSDKGFNNKDFKISLSDDRHTGGKSSIEIIKQSKELVYRYVLNNKNSASAVRLVIQPSDSQFVDLSKYNKVFVSLKSGHRMKVPIIICDHIPAYSKESNIDSYHPLINYIPVSTTPSRQELSLRDFVTPDWWYAFVSDKYQNEDSDMKSVKYILLANSRFYDKTDRDEVTISELRFEYDFTLFFIVASIGTLLYYLVYVLMFHSPLLRIERIRLLYKQVDTVNYEDHDKNVVLTFIRDNFKNPELTVTDVQQATGIHERKVSGIIKKHANASFKQYLNAQRIEVAKKQLSATTLPISTIAYECGYNNITHFNRVFKAQVNQSPQEFRLSKN